MAKEQVSCLLVEPGAGAKYMGEFDMLPPEARALLRNSPYNLCPLCFIGEAWRLGHQEAHDKMCMMVRAQEDENA